MSATSSDGHIFDLDGVLWNSNSLHKLTIEAICQNNSLIPLPYETLAGKPSNEVFRLILAANNHKPHDFDLVTMLTREKQSAFLDLASSGNIKIQNLEVIQEISKFKPCALVSGASLNTVELYLKLLGSNPFECVLTGQNFKPKPSPEGFLKAAAGLGFAPNNCTVYEDSENGLDAADKGGFNYYHMYGDWSESCQTRHLEKTSLLGCHKELIDLLL